MVRLGRSFSVTRLHRETPFFALGSLARAKLRKKFVIERAVPDFGTAQGRKRRL
jgi:hypothetical protein